MEYSELYNGTLLENARNLASETAEILAGHSVLDEYNIEKMSPLDLVIGMYKSISGEELEIGKYELVTIIFEDNENSLHRWGGDFIVSIDDMGIKTNTLSCRAWSYKTTERIEEANRAILFFARQFVNNPRSMSAKILARFHEF